MSSGSFNTQAATMAQASKHVQNVNEQIGTDLRTLFSSVEGVRAHWKGDAANAFQDLMQRWQQDSTKLSQALAGISEQIGASGKAYQTSEDTNTSTLRSSGSGLNL